MAASLKISASEGRRTRAVVGWIALLLAAGAVIGLLLPAQPPQANEPSSEPLSTETAGEACLRLSENPSDYLSQEALNSRYELRSASCKMAFAAEPGNVHYKVAVARAMPIAQRSEQLSMLREAAAQDDAEAYYQIYESHKSWDQGDLDKPQLVTRAEADRALRKAAELGHPLSTQMLALLLDRGGIVRRDREAAIYWAERAVANPARDETRANLQVLLGRLLVKSASPDERARGLDLLEKLGKAGPFDAKTELAIAIRKDDPVRARALLEESLPSNPGGAGAACGNADIRGRRPGQCAARAVALEGAFGHGWGESCPWAALCRGPAGAARRAGGRAPDRHREPMGTRLAPARAAAAGGPSRRAAQRSQERALRRRNGRGTRRARRAGRADRPQALRECPVPGPARSL